MKKEEEKKLKFHGNEKQLDVNKKSKFIHVSGEPIK